jgi:hypothetical protein
LEVPGQLQGVFVALAIEKFLKNLYFCDDLAKKAEIGIGPFLVYFERIENSTNPCESDSSVAPRHLDRRELLAKMPKFGRLTGWSSQSSG